MAEINTKEALPGEDYAAYMARQGFPQNTSPDYNVNRNDTVATSPTLPTTTPPPVTPSSKPAEKKDITIGDYTIGPDGTIVSGPTVGKYQVGSNVSQYQDLGDEYESKKTGQSVEQIQLDRQQKNFMDEADRVTAQINGYASGAIPLTTAQQAQVDGLRQQFQQLIDQQVLTNTGATGMANIRGFQAGAAEYDPNFQIKTIGSIVTAGQNKIADLNIKMAAAVAELTESFKDNNIERVKKAWDVYSDAAKERIKSLQETIDTTAKAIQDARDFAYQQEQDRLELQAKEEKDVYDRVTKPIQDIAKEAAKNGASPEVIAKLNQAKTVEEAIAMADGYLEAGTGLLGDYIRYKRDAIAKGIEPVTYQEYKIADEERKARNARLLKATSVDSSGSIIAVGGTGGDYEGVLSTILGSGKFTKDQVRLITNAIRNGEDPLTVVKNQAKNIAGQTEANKLSSFETARTAILDLDKALTDFYAMGGSTGILEGNYENVINKLGEVDNPKLVSIATQIAAALQIYRNAVSGTAYSEQEGKDIASIFPGINKTEGLNDAIISGRLAAFDSVIDGAYRNVLGASYDTLKKLESGSTASELLLQQEDKEQVVTTGLERAKTSNPKLYQTVSTMWTSTNPATGQPYTADDILKAFPELNQ